MTSLADIEVQDSDGELVRIGEVIERPTILVLPRYYGCLPCRDYLAQVSARLDEVTNLGGAAISISPAAANQARWLRDEKGIRVPMLVDPDRAVFDALELPRRWWVGLNPRGWWNYAKAIARGNRQGRILEPNQLPGLAILDADANLVSIHRGRALGDYPELESVLAELGELTTQAGAPVG